MVAGSSPAGPTIFHEVKVEEKPSREPDLKLENYWFYFKEMVQWNIRCKGTYDIRVLKGFGFQFFSNDRDRWVVYDLCDRDVIYESYINWQVENILLERA